MDHIRIVGIVLVRNEDRFLHYVLTNISAFCDTIIVADHLSTDKTADIVQSLLIKYINIEYVRIKKPSQSHELIKRYINTKTWVFGVDGDEIYDPLGLHLLRKDLLNGRFQEWWQIFGNVLNVVNLDMKAMVVTAYSAPPCRSMVKLFNFNAITSWEEVCHERLHGGKPVFKEDYTDSKRHMLHQNNSWDESKLRCLHLCLLPRSSVDKKTEGLRLNIMEISAMGRLGRLLHMITLWKPRMSLYKKEKYTRGLLKTYCVKCFFNH